LTLMQDEAGLAGTAAKVSAGLHALPAQGAYTFANVAAQLEDIAVEKDQDSAASMLSLNGRARGPVVPQAPLLSKSVSLSGAPAVADLGHLTELQRCQVMAIAEPEGLCTVHDKLHTWGDCPLLLNHAHSSVGSASRPHASHRSAVHATALQPGFEQSHQVVDSPLTAQKLHDFMSKVDSCVSRQQQVINSLCEAITAMRDTTW
jgi:hypothetical protein